MVFDIVSYYHCGPSVRVFWVDPVGADVEGRTRRALLDRWRASLDIGAPGLSVFDAVFPNCDVWLDGAGSPDLQGDAGVHRTRMIYQRLGTCKQSGRGTRLLCTAAPETMLSVRGRGPVCRSHRFPGLFRSQPGRSSWRF